MAEYDEDAADKFANFCFSLTRVSPTRAPVEDPALLQARTEPLWAGIRRVYFGEIESERHERVMDDLRDEIAELEENLRLPPSLGNPPRSPQRKRQKDDDDDPGFSGGSDGVSSSMRASSLTGSGTDVTVPSAPPGAAASRSKGGTSKSRGTSRSVQSVPENVSSDLVVPYPFLSDREAIIGSTFWDIDLEWCRVSGWGHYCRKFPVYFCHPEASVDMKRDEDFSSESEVLAWIKKSPARIPDDVARRPECHVPWPQPKLDLRACMRFVPPL